MSQALLDELKRENLCTHFVLPFLKLSKVSFTAGNFVNSYLTTDRASVVVKIADLILLSRAVYRHPDLRGLYRIQDGYLVEFVLRREWKADVELFCNGKFSMMSHRAKDYIIRHSGLSYKEKQGTKVLTDARLLALEKHKILKGMWEKMLYSRTGQDRDDPDNFLPEEYLSIPGEKSYIDLTGLTKIGRAQL